MSHSGVCGFLTTICQQCQILYIRQRLSSFCHIHIVVYNKYLTPVKMHYEINKIQINMYLHVYCWPLIYNSYLIVPLVVLLISILIGVVFCTCTRRHNPFSLYFLSSLFSLQTCRGDTINKNKKVISDFHSEEVIAGQRWKCVKICLREQPWLHIQLTRV